MRISILPPNDSCSVYFLFMCIEIFFKKFLFFLKEIVSLIHNPGEIAFNTLAQK